jgi:hypothetical protein
MRSRQHVNLRPVPRPSGGPRSPWWCSLLSALLAYAAADRSDFLWFDERGAADLQGPIAAKTEFGVRWRQRWWCSLDQPPRRGGDTWWYGEGEGSRSRGCALVAGSSSFGRGRTGRPLPAHRQPFMCSIRHGGRHRPFRLHLPEVLVSTFCGHPAAGLRRRSMLSGTLGRPPRRRSGVGEVTAVLRPPSSVLAGIAAEHTASRSSLDLTVAALSPVRDTSMSTSHAGLTVRLASPFRSSLRRHAVHRVWSGRGGSKLSLSRGTRGHRIIAMAVILVFV